LTEQLVAIIVAFDPDSEHLKKSLRRLRAQVSWTIVVDNASSSNVAPILSDCGNENVELLRLPENQGIGAGQNAGIERAMALGADYVLLLDQDSVTTDGMVAQLYSAIHAAEQCSGTRPIAAAGPSCMDAEGYRQFFVPENAVWPRPWQPGNEATALPPYIETRFLVASGTLIPVAALRAIGGMRSDYFIDQVDREWCFRATAHGYRLLGVPAAVLDHQVGQPIRRSFGRFTITYRWHRPLRNYYMFRNALLMLRDTPVPATWKVYFFLRLMRYASGACLLFDDRRERLSCITRGLLHGLTDVRGRYDTRVKRCTPLPVSTIEQTTRPKDQE